MKKLVLSIHLYVGLFASLFLSAVSISGAVIAFETELNRTFHPQLTNVNPGVRPLDWDSVRERVEQQAPGWKLIRFIFLTGLIGPRTFGCARTRPIVFAMSMSTNTLASLLAAQKMEATGS